MAALKENVDGVEGEVKRRKKKRIFFFFCTEKAAPKHHFLFNEFNYPRKRIPRNNFYPKKESNKIK